MVMTMTNRGACLLILFAATLAGCPAPASTVCVRNSDCETGSYCSAGACVSDCTPATVAMECGAGATCSTFGMCLSPPDGGMRDASVMPPSDTGTDAFDDRPACVIAGGTDDDGDGYCADAAIDVDCDDTAAETHPGATETCTPSTVGATASDEDCDGALDDGCGWFFGRPHWVSRARTTTASAGSPILMDDGLRLYLRGGSPAGTSMLVAARPSVGEPFSTPVPVAGSDMAFVAVGSGFTISADELEVIVHGGTDLNVTTRTSTSAPFGPRTPIMELNDPTANDRFPWLGVDDLEILFVSARTGVDRIFRSTRSSTSAPWMPPVEITLDWTPSPMGEATPSLSQDGLTMFFSVNTPTGRVLYRAARASSDSGEFDTPVDLATLNSADGATVYPFVSEATREVFFTSGREWSPGPTDSLWRAELCRDGECPTRTGVDCPLGGRRSDDQMHCYTALTTLQPWGNAYSACGTGHLVTIHSAAENALALLVAAGARSWLGAYDGTGLGGDPSVPQCTTAVPGCGFAWVTGEPWTFSLWGPGEPNDGAGSGAEDAAEFNATRWNDGMRSSSLAAVCETELWPTW
jgi:hypothetical protein